MAAAAADAGLRFVPEAFADRRYLPDGSLQSRAEAGSVIHDPSAAAAQALMAEAGYANGFDVTLHRTLARTPEVLVRMRLHERREPDVDAGANTDPTPVQMLHNLKTNSLP